MKYLLFYKFIGYYIGISVPGIQFPPSCTHMDMHSLHTLFLDHVKWRSATRRKYFSLMLQSLHGHHGKLTRTNMGLSGKVSSNTRSIKSLVYFSDKCNTLLIKCIYKMINCFDENYSYSCYSSGWLYLSPVSFSWSKLFLCASGVYIFKTKCLMMVAFLKIGAFMQFKSYVVYKHL